MTYKPASALRPRRNPSDFGSDRWSGDAIDLDHSTKIESNIIEEQDRYQARNKRRALQYTLLFIVMFGALVVLLFKSLVTHYNRPVSWSRPTASRQTQYFNGSEYFNPTVILISLDGFRNDYLDRDVTPCLARLADHGVRARYMMPSFPSITFPNHWTLATGLYPEAHGIVANEFHDPILQQDFIHKKNDISSNPQWWSGEPIWKTSTVQGKPSGVIMWPGSFVSTMKPDLLVGYNRSVNADAKMDITLSWLDLPAEKRPEMIAVYIPDVDQKGHGGGPDGKQMNATLAKVDRAVERLLNGLEQRNLDSHVHVVVVSDHGMTATHKSRVIFFDDIISAESLSFLRHREGWPLLDLRPKDDAPAHAVDQIFRELYDYTQRVEDPHFQVYLRENVPERFHYSATDRIAPIVTIPDVGYTFATHRDFNPDMEYRPRGMHGYDNQAYDMRAIFMAKGPKVDQQFGQGAVLEPFENVELYSFVASLLNLNPAPNNGTLNGLLLKRTAK